jgi:pimeloyl-ACP methyl ester carboxylesterase
MAKQQVQTGYVNSGNAKLYYEITGTGAPFAMIHAGVADSRQWSNEFAYFSHHYRVIRHDLRGYGKSEPVEGEFSHMGDFIALLDALKVHEPVIIMGCSMGGGLAMDFALTHPTRVKAIIMAGSGPGGLELDVPTPPKFAEVDKAYKAGDMDLVAELDAQVWFDGSGRTPEQVNPGMRKLMLEMDRLALSHEVRGLGKQMPNIASPAYARLDELNLPVLIIVGSHDTPYILAAADYMKERIKTAMKIVIEDAAHLSNMDQPEEFRRIVEKFLAPTEKDFNS